MNTALEPEATPAGRQPEATPAGRQPEAATNGSQLDHMIVGCLDKLKEAGYIVKGGFPAPSYEYVFMATRDSNKYPFFLSAKEQIDRDYDRFFKWAAGLLESASRRT